MSSTAVTVNVVNEVLAGIVTDDTTVAADELLLVRVTVKGLPISELLRVTDPVVDPPFSLIVLVSNDTTSVSESLTVTEPVTATYPGKLAVMVADCEPSRIASSTAETVKLADAALAGIVTWLGTVASVVSLLDNVTRIALEMSVLPRVTVPVAVPPFSLIDEGETTTVSVSKSVTLSVSLAFGNPVAVAEIVTFWRPSNSVSSTAVTVKVAEVWFARIVTVAGTVASLVSLLTSVTINGALKSVPPRTTVPIIVPPPDSDSKWDASDTLSKSLSVTWIV